MSGASIPNLPPAKPPEPPTNQPSRDWRRLLLDGSVVLAGPPTLFTIVASFFTERNRIIAIYAGVGLIVAIALMLLPPLLKTMRLLAILPWLLSGVLAVLLVLVVTPNRLREQNKLLASSWLAWQEELEKSAELCKNKSDTKCLAQNVDPVLAKRPQPLHDSDITGMASDVIAGQLLLANDNIRAVLKNKIGIADKFLGSGVSEPVGNTDYTAAKVSEYFVPNLSESTPHVWRWDLHPSDLIDGKPLIEHNLIETLLHTPPNNHADFNKNWTWISKDHLGQHDPRPALIRYALLDLKKIKPSGCLGRLDASRVFMSNLGEVQNKTISEAASASGYTVSPGADEAAVHLFVWIYVPTEEGIVFPATWKTLMAKFGEWSTADTCTPATQGKPEQALPRSEKF